MEACAKILHIDTTIFVEVESEVVVLDKDLHVAISLSHVVNQFVLTLSQNLDQHADEVVSLVVVKHNFLRQVAKGFDATAFYSLEFLNVMNVGISELVCLAFLDKLETFATLV